MLSVENVVFVDAALGKVAESAGVSLLRSAGGGWGAVVRVFGCVPVLVELGLCFRLVGGVRLMVPVVSRRFSGRLKRLAVGC